MIETTARATVNEPLWYVQLLKQYANTLTSYVYLYVLTDKVKQMKWIKLRPGWNGKAITQNKLNMKKKYIYIKSHT